MLSGLCRGFRGARFGLMRFGVLGRLEVFQADGSPVPIAGPARRLVLAALLARAGSQVSGPTLVDDLWGPDAPRSALGNLRSHVARLRDNLGRGQVLLQTEGDGYRLCIGPGDLDAEQFQTTLAEAASLADPRAAMACYDAALSLWRDEAYVEFGEAPFAVGERVRLAELRIRAMERRTELALQVGMAGELIGELEQRVRGQPYRERGWEQLALALYRDGRQADALHACRRARAVLVEDLGIDPGPRLQETESRILRQDPDLLGQTPAHPNPVAARQDRCPYLGLTGYEETDAPLFVGRERLTSVLAGQLADHSTVIVTGASGVGKSSLVRAGLVPALRAGAIPGSAVWRISVRTPSSARADDGRQPDLVVVDQAEELFTVLDPDAAWALVRNLTDYVTYGDGRLLLVLRSDYFGRLAEFAALAPLAQRSAVLVAAMRADELRRALVEPAAAVGLRLEPDLLEAVMQDAADQAEPLPMLAQAMLRTWQHRQGDLLTLDGYRRAGGVAGALEAGAEECYQRLTSDRRAAARHLLVRMAAPSGMGGWVRRSLATSDITDTGPERGALDALAAARLIVVSAQRSDIAHDALLEQWPRLRGWLDERALAADLVDHLGRATAGWLVSGRDAADLYRGPRLTAALDWRAAHPYDVSPEENEFLDASARAAQAELAAAHEQVAREARGRRRLRRIAAVLGVVVLLAVGGGALAGHERGTAQRQARAAARAALTADASRLATLAASLNSDQRDVALLLGVQSYELQPSTISAGGLQTALMQTPAGLNQLLRYRSVGTLPHLDRSGRLLAVPGSDGSVTVYDLTTQRVMRRLTSSSPRQFAVFSTDDALVAAGGSDGTVAVWDLQTGRQSGAAVPVGGGVVHPIFDPTDDGRLYVIAGDGALSAWDRSDPGTPHLRLRFPALAAFQSAGTAPDLTISADGRLIAAGDGLTTTAGQCQIWDTRTGRTMHTFGPYGMGAFAAEGDLLPVGSGNDTLLLDARTGRAVASVANTGAAGSAVLSPDGARLAVPQQIGDLTAVAVYDVRSHRRIGAPLELQAGAVAPLGFLPDGRLVTSDADQAAVWSTGKDLPPLAVRIDIRQDLADQGGFESQYPQFLPGTADVLVNDWLRYDGTTGERIGPLPGGTADTPVALSPNGRYLASSSAAGLVIRDLVENRQISVLPGASPTAATQIAALVWSRDGSRVAADVGGSAAYVWQVADPEHPTQPRIVAAPGAGPLDDLQFTGDSRGLVLLSSGGTQLTAVELSTGKAGWTHTINDGYVRQLAVSPSGRTVVIDTSFSSSGRVSLLNARTGTTTTTINVPTWGGVGYLNHGQWLVISNDHPYPQAHLYDATTLQPFGIPFPTGDVDQHPLSVDPAETRFAEPIAFDQQRPLFDNPLVWTADPPSWIHTACAIAGRNLTLDEWRQYLPDRPYQENLRHLARPALTTTDPQGR